jgi:hydrogenase nickel incorporation protein HypA/HybF
LSIEVLTAPKGRRSEAVHELAVCQGIIEVALEALSRLGPPLPRVTEIHVEIGRLTGVVPDSLRFHFEVLAPRTPLARAWLDIETVPVRARCAECEARFEIDIPTFICPDCGSGLLELTSGRELRVVSLDTAEGVPSAR